MEEKWQKMNIMRIRKKELIAEVKNQIFNKTSTREIKKKMLIIWENVETSCLYFNHDVNMGDYIP